MEAPEKIYIDANEDWHRTYTAFTEKAKGNDIEYVRTDAFIEKACLWLSNVSIEDMAYKYGDFDTSEDWYKFIEDFKKYMEGE